MPWTKSFLDHRERNAVLRMLKANGIKPPKMGWCVKALGGEICRHPPSKHHPGDTGYQAISIAKPTSLGGLRRRKRK